MSFKDYKLRCPTICEGMLHWAIVNVNDDVPTYMCTPVDGQHLDETMNDLYRKSINHMVEEEFEELVPGMSKYVNTFLKTRAYQEFRNNNKSETKATKKMLEENTLS